MIGIATIGLNAFLKTLDKMKEVTESDDTFEYFAQRAKQYAEEYCPRDTGELVNSIYVEILPDGFILGATAGHAIFNEYGCYNLPCGSPSSPVPAKYIGFRPFLRPAIFKVKSEFSEIFGKKVLVIAYHG